MFVDFSNPRDTKFIIIFLQLGENVWADFAKGDDHVVPAENCEVLDLSAILFDNNKKSRHEADFEKSKYGKSSKLTLIYFLVWVLKQMCRYQGGNCNESNRPICSSSTVPEAASIRPKIRVKDIAAAAAAATLFSSYCFEHF
ncbi:hypothetical protein B296_00019451 [Ensete ventricosum]|uniref:Uncharacterized protein n=1 Tax=Ensete ventricosum TaxID=4639 RepID=A0A427AHJ2_ENSVE|nr:hypothetical protein B296_00019451 [Ensete ventricosum]